MRLPPYRGGIRPVGAIRVNQDSPQARNLWRWWRFQSLVDDTRSGASALSVGGGVIVPASTVVGVGHNVGSSAPLTANLAHDFPSYEGALALWIRADFPSSTSGTYYQFFDAATSRHAYYMNTPNEIQMYNDGKISNFGGLSWAAGDLLHFVFAWNRSIGAQRLWVNGISKSGSVAGTWGSNYAGEFFFFQRYNGIQVMPCAAIDARLYSNMMPSDADVGHLFAPETRWDLYAPA